MGAVLTQHSLGTEGCFVCCANSTVSRLEVTSQIGIGGVLMEDNTNNLQPLVFLSRQLKPPEQCYSAYECELAAMVYCFQA